MLITALDGAWGLSFCLRDAAHLNKDVCTSLLDFSESLVGELSVQDRLSIHSSFSSVTFSALFNAIYNTLLIGKIVTDELKSDSWRLTASFAQKPSSEAAMTSDTG